ncbi:MAG: hypothetical protein V1781_02180 [Bacteroidota bacterium]
MIAAEKRYKSTGIIGTMIVHLLLLALFFFAKCSSDIRPPEIEESGILINFGNSDEGMGNVQTKEITNNIVEKVNQQSQSLVQQTVVKNILTQDIEEAPNISKKNKTQTEQQQQPSNELVNAFSKLNNKSSNASEGITGNPGNQGDLSGSLNSDNYSKGTGNDFNWKLKGTGRKMIGKIEIFDKSQETGIVAVEIIVNKFGKVTKANPILMGSTTTNQYLWNKAKEGLLNKILYNQIPTGDEARGIIYINFTVR